MKRRRFKLDGEEVDIKTEIILKELIKGKDHKIEKIGLNANGDMCFKLEFADGDIFTMTFEEEEI